MADLFYENLLEDQIDSKVKSILANDFKQPETHTAEVLRKDLEGRWWVRFSGSDEETPIMVNKIDMRVGDIVTVTVKDHQSIADGNLTSPALSAANTYGYVNRVIADVIKASEAEIGYLKADVATIGYAQIQDADITNARIQNLVYEVTTNTNHLTAVDASILDLQTNSLTANSAVITNLQGETAKIQDFTAEDFQATFGFVSELSAENIDASSIIADHAEVLDLNVNYAHVTDGEIDNANISHARINGLESNYARIDAANVTVAEFQTAWADSIMVQTGLLAKEGTVYSLDAIEVNAVNITAGTLDVERLVVTVDGSKYVVNMVPTYLETSDSDIYRLSSGVFDYEPTIDEEIDPLKTYYVFDNITSEYSEVANPVVENIGYYFEKRYKPFDIYADYYELDSLTGEYSVVGDPDEEDFDSYYERIDPKKVYYEYDSQDDTYIPVDLPQEINLNDYYERMVSPDYLKLDGDILGDRTISADKLLAHSITTAELTAENIEGAGGWINLANGTFNYVNAQTGKGISWDGSDLKIYGGYGELLTSYHDVVGVSAWMADHTVPTSDTAVSEGVVYFSLSDGVYSEVVDPGSVYSLTADAIVDQSKNYYSLQDGVYAVVTPEPTDNPLSEGWYELGNPLLQGLYVLDQDLYTFLSSHLTSDENGTKIKNGTVGYSISIGNDGVYILADGGETVGKYGTDMQIGALSDTHIAASGDTFMFLPAGASAVMYKKLTVAEGDPVIGLYEQDSDSGAYFPTSDTIASEGKTYYNPPVPNIDEAVAYIAVSKEPPYESVFYMTRSVVVQDMYLGEKKWKWWKRANNNLSLKWMGAM